MESTTFPQAPAPVIGIQRRRALCAVTAVKGVLDLAGDGIANKNAAMRALVKDIMDAHDNVVKETIRGVKLSAGGRRELDAQFTSLGGYVESCQSRTGEDAAYHWSALLVAVSALVVDAMATARAITMRDCWRRLQAKMDELADILTATFPGCDIDGTNMYMEISR